MIAPSSADHVMQFGTAVDVQRNSIRRMPEQGLGFGEVEALDLCAIQTRLFVLQRQCEPRQVVS